MAAVVTGVLALGCSSKREPAPQPMPPTPTTVAPPGAAPAVVVAPDAAGSAIAVAPATAWPTLDCSIDDITVNARRIQKWSGGVAGVTGEEADDLKASLVPSAGPYHRYFAACVAALLGDHATARTFVAALAAPTCTHGGVVLSTMATDDCHWEEAAITAGKTATLAVVDARRQRAVAALRTRDGAGFADLIADPIAVTLVGEGPPTTTKLSLAEFRKTYADPQRYLAMDSGRPRACEGTCCSFVTAMLSHGAEYVTRMCFQSTSPTAKVVSLELRN